MIAVSIDAKMMATIVILMAIVITANCQPQPNLLVGRLISQGANRNEVLGAARSEGVPTGQIKTVQGKEVAESGRQLISPGNELEVGNLVKEFQQNPMDQEVLRTRGFRGSLRYVERKKGKLLDFETAKYVPNPVKVLAEIKANGGDIDTVEGEIVAGDAGDIDVVNMKENVVPAVNVPNHFDLTTCCIQKGVSIRCAGLCDLRDLAKELGYSSRNTLQTGLGACAKFQTAIETCTNQGPEIPKSRQNGNCFPARDC